MTEDIYFTQCSIALCMANGY